MRKFKHKGVITADTLGGLLNFQEFKINDVALHSMETLGDPAGGQCTAPGDSGLTDARAQVLASTSTRSAAATP